ncbi:hypothetical protein M3Y94_00524200 [Aphelenchoides besseyi]|nr:hypothetical protein M3Y94_00524200 [Aphelenchoides besseyi]
MIIERVDDGTVKLTILNATKDDVGNYECRAVNRISQARTSAELKYATQHAVEEPSFEEGALLGFSRTLNDMTAPQGSTVVLECQLDDHTLSLPGLEIKWTRNNNEAIPYANSSTTKLPDGTLRLTLENVSVNDVAKYKCAIYHAHSSVFTESRLTITAPLPGKAPEFVELLKSATTTVGGTAQLKCKVVGEPRPEITWSVNGEKVHESEKITLEHHNDGTLILTIKDAQLADTAEFRAFAENQLGSAWTGKNHLLLSFLQLIFVEGPIVVVAAGTLPSESEGFAPDFESPIRPVTVNEGEDAVFTGTVTGQPFPEIKWFKGGIELDVNNPQYKIESLPDGTQKLTIFKAKIEDADAEVRCAAQNKWGEVWSDATLTVKKAEEPSGSTGPPLVVRELEDVRVVEGDEAKLVCAFTGQQPIQIKWFKGIQEISANDAHYKISIEADGTTSLTISQSEKSDAASFVARGSNSLGIGQTEGKLIVTERPPVETAPKFLKELQPIETTEGKGCVFECQISGNPKPTVEWFKDGKKLEPNDNIRMEVLPDGTCRLILDKCADKDQGLYSVTLTSPLGVAQSEAPLKVKPSDRLRLKRGLEDQDLTRGQKLVLSAEVSARPETVKWFKANEEVSASETTKLEKVTDEIYKLEIERAELSDSSNWKVVFTRGPDTVESTCKVTVKEQVPTFKKGLEDQTLPMGEPLVLEIEAAGEPSNVEWKKDGKPVDDRAQLRDLGAGKFSLTIPTTQESDFGQFSVRISNQAGDGNESTGKVECSTPKVQKPEILQGLQPVTVAPGEDAKFEAKVKNPISQVKWYKNGDELTNPKTTHPDDETYGLEIPNVQKDSAAVYKVVFVNQEGEADSSAQLTLKQPPIQILKRLEDLEVPLGTKVVLEIETNQPVKAVRWYRNGNELQPNDKAQPQSVNDKVHQLVLPNVEKDASGTYKAIVQGDNDDQDESSCALTVKLPPVEKPGFAKGLEDTIVPLGQPLELEVKTTGAPAKVQWFKNGTPLSANERIQLIKVDDNTYKLVIPKSALDDSGNYEVEIETDGVGSARTKGTVTVEPKIEFLTPLRDLDVVEGERVEFTVETNTKPHQIRWYQNGNELKADNRIELTADGCKISAILKWAVKEDQGDYKVVLTNSHGDADSSAKLTVRKAIKEPPKILRGLENQIVAKGAQMVFEVEVEGEVTDVQWKKDGQDAAKATSAKIEKIGDNIYRLTIPAAELSDSGDWSVVLSNPDGKVKSEATAEVDEKPSIVNGLIPAQLDEGDEHLFRVEVSAPVREVKWYKNGQELQPGPKLVFKQVNPKKYELLIPSAQVDHEGEFKVVLSNKAGECDSSAALTVKKPVVVKLLRGLQDVEINESEPLEMSCKVEGVPKGVQWFKNGQPVEANDRIKLIANEADGEYKLLIDSSIPSDAAAYRVVFLTDKGDVFSGAVARVNKKRDEPKTTPPMFLSPLQDTEIVEGETLSLKCQIGGEPMPTLRWYRNGEELKPDDRIAIRLASDGTATLRIRDARKSDSGEFLVKASSPNHPDAESKCKASVISEDELPSKPKFIIPLKPTKSDIGARAEFTVKVRGVPTPELSFKLNGKPLDIDGSRIKLEDMKDGNWLLTIADVQEEDFGELSCKATNENGTDECSASFGPSKDREPKEREENYPPRFNVPLHDRRVPEGSLLTIECFVDAKPVAEVSWEKDGKPLPAGIETEYDPLTGACRLKIPNFNSESTGSFLCKAQNQLGVATTACHLDVDVEKPEEKTEEKESPPKFNPGLEDKSIPAGADLTLTCRVTGSPLPNGVIWNRDGIPLRETDRVKSSFDPETGECELTIKDAQESEAGVYRALVESRLGSANTSCNVSVKAPKPEAQEKGEGPRFVKGLIDQWIDKGDTLTFTCELAPNTTPVEVKWYKNGQLLKPTDRIQIEHTPEGVCRLTIKKLYDVR